MICQLNINNIVLNRSQYLLKPAQQLTDTNLVRNISYGSCLERFAPISLKEMDAVALLNRVDTKFVLTNSQLASVLQSLPAEYRVLCIENQRSNHYRTLYFDTPDFKLFNLHVNENAERYKVRIREYLDTFESFLEVKHKTRKNRTIKDRISTLSLQPNLTLEAERWLDDTFPYDSRNLEPKLWNTFTRMTLVNEVSCERVTLDTDLVFYSKQNYIRLDGLAVAEVKMSSGHQDSAFMQQMESRRIHPQGFSKYCMGVSMLYQDVKKNALKPKLLLMKKMIEGAVEYE